MKKLLSIFCSLALLLAVGVPAFADTGTGVPSEITSALAGTVTAGHYRYSCEADDSAKLAAYWSSLNPSPDADGVTAIADRITSIKGNLANDSSDDVTVLWALIAASDNFTTIRSILGNPTVGIPTLSGNKVTLTLTKDNHSYPITLTRTAVSSDNGSHNDNSSSTTPTQPSTQISVTTGTDGKQAVTVAAQPDSTAVSNGTASLQSTIPAEAVTAVSSGKGAGISITAPTSAIVSQLNSAAVQSVSLTITAPSGIAYNNVEHASVALNVEAGVLEAAKQAKKDVTVGVVDASTGKQVYSWTFKGADLANAAALTGVNLALNTATSTLIPAVTSALPASAKGVVLTFGNSGTLPAPAAVKVLITDQGFQPGETVYAYYFNAASGKMEQLDAASYTVDANGYISLTIAHTSQYVVLPVQVPSVKPVALDTGARLTVKAGKTYQFKITSSAKPTFVCGNGSVFKVSGNGSKGNAYFFKVTAVGKAGSSAGFYVNGEKSPRTIGSIA